MVYKPTYNWGAPSCTHPGPNVPGSASPIPGSTAAFDLLIWNTQGIPLNVKVIGKSATFGLGVEAPTHPKCDTTGACLIRDPQFPGIT